MKRLSIAIAMFIAFTSVAQKEKESFLTQHINIGLNISNYSGFKLNNYLAEQQITSIKPLTFGGKLNFNYMFKNNFGFYTSFDINSSINKQNNQTNMLKVFKVQVGPSYRFLNKPKLAMVISPLYSNETLGVNLTFNSALNVNSLLQNKSGNSLQFYKVNHYVGLNLSTLMFDLFTIDLNYSYNVNQSAFYLEGNSAQNTLPTGRNNVFTVSILTKIK